MILESSSYSNFISLIILSNIITSALEGMIDEEMILESNLFFNLIFLTELIAKLIALDLLRKLKLYYSSIYKIILAYIRDRMNVLDLVILLFSLLENMLRKMSIDYIHIRFLSAMKIFRSFRFLRNIIFLRLIVNILYKSFTSFIYLFILLLLFNFVYALVGMELFGGYLDVGSEIYPGNNFDSFSVAFLNVFNIMTLDNWIQPLTLTYNSSAGR